jgi:DNA topoisomerase I
MKLVIVESPTKAKTIGKFLGSEYDVQSSYGHIRDLPKSKISINVKKDFEPTYVIPPKAKETVENLKKRTKKSSTIILATDEDREGEAIAWHLVSALELENPKSKNPPSIQRIVFHEITENAIKEALKNPRSLDMNLVNAQQARRVLDRLVGYELSPFLWRKIRYGLSAGRVQSVAVRLIVEREREIQKFISEEYWSIEAEFSKLKDKHKFTSRLYSIGGKTLGKMDLGNESETKKILSGLDKASYEVSDLATKDITRTPAPPFTTSTLQQEAARKYGFSAKQTMMIAQQLYENGVITYMRTDSINLAASALNQAREVITSRFGKNYSLPSPRFYTNKSKNAQEAHEAIRPTNLSLTPENLRSKDRGHVKLYDLIWRRTIACQMQTALMEQTTVTIDASKENAVFRANGQIVKFDGFMKVYTESRDDNSDDSNERILPKLERQEKLTLHELLPLQHFTEPPPRYTDATLIKALEADGIGRPSTYAPTLTTIQDRGYAEKIEKKYHPTEIGILVNDLLVEHFPEIVDLEFTAKMEEELDEIAEGKMDWVKTCQEFYTPFKKHLTEKEATVEKQIEISDTPCPHCSKPMLIKFGRMGKFLACPDPEVKVTLPMPEEAAKIKELQEKTKDERCMICDKPMVVKRGRFGFFLGCVDYPKCKGISKIWNKTGFKCPLCLETPERKDKPGDIVEKRGRGRGKPFYACTRYPDCEFVMNKKPENENELNEALTAWKIKISTPNKKISKTKSKKA